MGNSQGGEKKNLFGTEEKRFRGPCLFANESLKLCFPRRSKWSRLTAGRNLIHEIAGSADTLSISYIVAHLHRRVAIIGQGRAGHAGPNKLERPPRRFAPAITRTAIKIMCQSIGPRSIRSICHGKFSGKYAALGAILPDADTRQNMKIVLGNVTGSYLSQYRNASLASPNIYYIGQIS